MNPEPRTGGTWVEAWHELVVLADGAGVQPRPGAAMRPEPDGGRRGTLFEDRRLWSSTPQMAGQSLCAIRGARAEARQSIQLWRAWFAAGVPVNGAPTNMVGLMACIGAPPLLRQALGGLKSVSRHRYDQDLRYFPLKSAPQVWTKVNFRFCDLAAGAWRDCGDVAPFLLGLIGLLEHKISNDFAAGLLWLGVVASRRLGLVPALWLICVAADPDTAKAVNLAIKGYGIARCWGAQFCAELSTLAGRGVQGTTLEQDVAHRLVANPPQVAPFKPDDIRRAVRAVLSQELPQRVHVPDEGEYWARRYLIKANGSFSGAAMRHPWVCKPVTHSGVRPRKHDWLEAQAEFKWDCDPVVYATHSLKLEHGKTRHLYACDAVSWIQFDRVLGAVEKAWLGRHVLLDPGSRGLREWAAILCQAGVEYVAIDADDFNSQHSVPAMQLVFECLQDCVDVDITWLVESWQHMFLVNYPSPGQTAQLLSGLPSGHRATTFVNSVLNAAYSRLAIGPDYDELACAWHTGDDIVVGTRPGKGLALLERVLQSPLRANRSKCCVGDAEFLRHVYSNDGVFGYVARRISSLLSGNWVHETENDAQARLTSIYQGLWTVAARCGDRQASGFVFQALSRYMDCSDQIRYAFACLKAAPQGLPTLQSGGHCYQLEWAQPMAATATVPAGAHSYATQDLVTVLGRELGLTTIGAARAASILARRSYTQPGRKDAVPRVGVVAHTLPRDVPAVCVDVRKAAVPPKRPDSMALNLLESSLPEPDRYVLWAELAGRPPPPDAVSASAICTRFVPLQTVAGLHQTRLLTTARRYRAA